MQPNPTILTRIVALVAVALVAALAAMLLVTFRGPPPHSRPLSLDEVVTAIRTGRSPTTDWSLKRAGTANLTDLTPALPILSNDLAARLGPDYQNVRVYIAKMPTRGPGPREFGPGAFGPGPGPRPAMDRNPPFGAMRTRIPFLHDAIAVTWTMDGRMHALEGHQGAPVRWYAVTLSLMLLIFALLLAPTWYVARRITHPLRKLAEGVAAERIDDARPLPVAGPPEVRHLGNAFNQMHAKLVGHVAERTNMLVAIAHDLRTPMMRLSFRLDELPEATRVRAESDIEEMRRMIASLLDFVKSGSDAPALVRMELSALVETFTDEMEVVGQSVALEQTERAVISGDAALLRRCIGNLVENAQRYGGGALLSLHVVGGHAELSVDDEGPGVSEAQLARLTEPFYRAEGSRNRATGGTGLGLSIAKSIAEKHGGTLILANRPEGGFRATLRLPLAM